MFCKRIGFLLALAAGTLCGWAETVSPAMVVKAVNSWIAQKAQMESPITGTVSSVRLHTLTNGAAFYVAKLTGGGFVVTSTDTEIDPVIAFSPAADLVEDSRNPLWSLLARDMADRQNSMASNNSGPRLMSAALPGGAPSVSPAAARWRSLTSSGDGSVSMSDKASADGAVGSSGRKSISDVRVAPLLKTKWGQGKDASGANCFNYYTPNHYVCGCTATAIAQIFRYHKFPKEAVEPESYECRIDGRYVWLTQKGGVYDWDNMPYVPGAKTTTSQRKAIGKLTYDVGLAVNAEYSRYSTSATWTYFPDLCWNWGYAHVATYGEKDEDYRWGFSVYEMESVLIPNLDAKLPVCISIADYSWGWRNDGHALIADGYGYCDDQFCVHLNMGWDGDCDAWYLLPDARTPYYRFDAVDFFVCNLYPEGPSYGAIISGRVLLSDTEKPVSGVVVMARSSSGEVQRTTTNAKGIYAFILDEDDWDVSLENATANSYPDVRSTSIYDSENEYGVDFWLDTHTVAFDANGGTCDKTEKENCYTTVGMLPTATRTGYTFVGWFTEANGGTEVTDSTLVTADVTYYAHWTPNTYTVVFDANGGEGTMEPMTFVYDQAQALRPNAFTNGDVAFRGWTFSRKRRMSFQDGDQAMNLAESGSVTLYAVWGEGLLQVEVGEYVKWPLEELGLQVPSDGSVYNVTAYGLPSGLKLVKSPAVTKKVKDTKTGKTKTVVVTPAGVDWWIEGVATAAVDYKMNPAYLTVSAGGTNYTAAVLAETLPQNVVDLGEIPVGVALNEQHWLPGLASGWSVSGLPSGLKYTAKLATTKTTKTVNKKSVTVVVTNALPDSVYGVPTKAGLFTMTAKKKVSGFYETLKYRVLVTPKPVDAGLFGETLANLETMAYVPFEWNLLDDVAAANGKVAKVSGLPAGLIFAAADAYAYENAKKKTGKYLKQAGQTIVGTPTKPGTYVVTFTKNVKSGKTTVAKTAQILWKVVPNDASLEMDFNTAGGVVTGGVVGLAYADLLAFSATEGAKVTASGLPKGITLANLGGGAWGFKGFTAKAGTYYVTVKATLNGRTVSQRLALKVSALPSWAKGTFDGCVVGLEDIDGAVRLTVAGDGKISGTLRELGTNWTVGASCYTGVEDGGTAYMCTNLVAKYVYSVKSGSKTVKKTLVRNLGIVVHEENVGAARRGVLEGEESESVGFIAHQNTWAGAYKALGKSLFYQSSKVQYRTYAYTVETCSVLTEREKLSLKITAAGVVTATLVHPTGKVDKKTKKEIVYKATWSTTLVPQTSPEDGVEGFRGVVHLYFPASSANGFEGLAGTLDFTP